LVCFSSNDTIQYNNPFSDSYFNPDYLTNTAGSCWQFLDIGKESEEKRITFFPNPTSDFLYIETQLPEEPSLMAITDITGRVVYQSTFSNKIDVSHLPKGMYVLSVFSNARQYISKVIVQ
jgi:hypothetical protein